MKQKQLNNLHRFEYSTFFLCKCARVSMNWDPKKAPKLDFNEDYYSVLEVDSVATSQELKKAYYKIVFKYHPDK